MCLLEVNLIKKGLSRTVHIGYKIFLRAVPPAILDTRRPFSLQKLYYPFQRLDTGSGKGIVEFNKWLISVQKRIHSGASSGSKYYKTGFHIYKNKADAVDIAWSKDEIIVEVKYTGVLAEGTELDDRKVVVAKRMYVPRRGRNEGKKE